MPDLARTTGRGFIVITAAKAWFMVTGAVINLGLPHFFALYPDQGTAAFGVYGLVINLVSIFNMVVITGTLQTVSKLVSEVPEGARGTLRRALKVQLFVGLPLAVAYLLAAPMSARLLKDESLSPFVRLSAGVILMYSFYAIFVGFFNGRKEFSRQAGLDIGFATIKTILVVGAVLAGLGVMGAIGGFVATAVIMTAVAVVWVLRRLSTAGEGKGASLETGEGRGSAIQGSGSARRILGYLLAIMAFTFCINFIIRADLFLLKRIAALRLDASGLAIEAFLQRSNELSGIYTAMANVARLPYQAVIAITFVAFPVISRATFEGDREGSRTYIRQTLRYSLIFIVSMAAPLVAESQPLVEALYPQGYGVGGEALTWLALGMVSFAVMFVGATVLISAGHPLQSLLVAAVTLAATGALNWLLLTTGEVGEPMLARAGLATALATTGGMLLTLALLYRLYSAGLPAFTVVRVVVSGALLVGLAGLLPVTPLVDAMGGGKLIALVLVALKMALVGFLFYLLLYLMREFGPADRDRLARVFRRRGRAGADTGVDDERTADT